MRIIKTIAAMKNPSLVIASFGIEPNRPARRTRLWQAGAIYININALVL